MAVTLTEVGNSSGSRRKEADLLPRLDDEPEEGVEPAVTEADIFLKAAMTLED